MSPAMFTESRLRVVLLSCRWRKGGKSGLHRQGRESLSLGLSLDDFSELKSAGLIRQSPAGYCRLLPAGYRFLDSLGVRWPDDTSFPKNGLCVPPDMHVALPSDGSERQRCGCPEKVKLW